ncbi:MAG: signal transduction histidine kinase [bacterium]|jgi:signal transduction histidine kinase
MSNELTNCPNKNILEYLRKSRIFKHLPEEVFIQLLPFCELKYFQAGENLLTEGKINRKVFFLVEGTIGVYASHELILTLSRQGDVIGEMSVIQNKPTSAQVIAVSNVEVFSIHAKYIGSFPKNFTTNRFGDALYRIFAMALCEKLVMTTNKAKHFEETNRQLAETRFELLESNQHLIHEVENRKKAEQEIRKLNNELEKRVEQRTEKLNQALLDLQSAQEQLVLSEKIASLGSLVAGISHEINTPVGIGVSSSSHLLKEINHLGDLYEKNEMTQNHFENFIGISRELSTILMGNLQRSSELIKSFKKLSTDQSIDIMREFNLKDYLNDILLSLYPKLKQGKHKVEVICNSDVWINSYPGVFSQIVTNLLINAIIHAYESQKEGKIKIEIEVLESNEVSFIFSDNGSGIPYDVLPRIFDPFFTTKRGSGGSGLGLHIVYNLVKYQLHGGIQCESKLGEGTQFSLKFPRQ